MSLIPILFDLLDDEPNYTFGLGCSPYLHPRTSRTVLNPCSWPSSSYLSSLAHQRHGNRNQQLAKGPHTGKDGFQVSLDVKHFAPNEISVKTVDDNTVVVEGKHEEKQDEHGHIYRHFVRRYTLPKEYNLRDVASTLSSDGVLTIKAPPPSNAIENKERVIHIQQTGPAHLSVKENPKEKSEVKMSE